MAEYDFKLESAIFDSLAPAPAIADRLSNQAENEAIPITSDSDDDDDYYARDPLNDSDCESDISHDSEYKGPTTPNFFPDNDNEPAAPAAPGHRHTHQRSAEEDWQGLFTRSWDSFEDLFRDVNRVAQRVGFGIVQERPSEAVKSPDGTILYYRRYDLSCCQGQETATGGTGKRQNSKSVKTGCRWGAKAVMRKKLDNKWWFDLVSRRNGGIQEHNHPMDTELAGNLAVHRRLARTSNVIASILRLNKQPKSTSSDIASAIRAEFPGIKIRTRDVTNVLVTERLRLAGPLTPTQQFLQHLTTSTGIFCRIDREGNDNKDITKPVTRVFWTYTWCIEQLRANPELWCLDCTYKVNRFNMPLLQICGITNLHTTFNIAYCLLSGEREECFEWVLNVMKELLTAEKIPEPRVIISDYDKAFKKACRKIFNNGTQHQICLWHVMKNVSFNTKKKWDGPLDGTALGDKGSDGSHLRDDDDADILANAANYSDTARAAGASLLRDADRAQYLQGARDNRIRPTLTRGRAPAGSDRTWVNDADGFLTAWSDVVYSDTEELFNENWELLKKEFSAQPGTFYIQFDILDYF